MPKITRIYYCGDNCIFAVIKSSNNKWKGSISMKKPQDIFDFIDRAVSLFYSKINMQPVYANVSLKNSSYWYTILLKGRIFPCIMMLIGFIAGLFITPEVINMINNRSVIGILLLVVTQIYSTILFSSIIFFIISQIFYYASRGNKRNIEIRWIHLSLIFLLPLVGTMTLFMPLWVA